MSAVIPTYWTLIALKHERTVHGRDCDWLEPACFWEDDELVIYCDGCSVVLDRRE